MAALLTCGLADPSSARANLPDDALRHIEEIWRPFVVDVGGNGKGVVVSLQPLVIATAAHVVEGKRSLNVSAPIITKALGKEELSVTRVKFVEGADLAFLWTGYGIVSDEHPLPSTPWPTQARIPRSRESLMAATFPFRGYWSHRDLIFEAASVSVDEFAVKVGGEDPKTKYRMHSVGLGIRLIPGDSGAPVFNGRAELVGLASAFIQKRTNKDRVNLVTPAEGIVPTKSSDFEPIGSARPSASLRPPPLYEVSAHAYRTTRLADHDGPAAVAMARCLDELDRLVAEGIGQGRLGKLSRDFDRDPVCQAAYEVIAAKWEEVVKMDQALGVVDAIHARSHIAVDSWENIPGFPSSGEVMANAETINMQAAAPWIRARAEYENLLDDALLGDANRLLSGDVHKWVFMSPETIDEQVRNEFIDSFVSIKMGNAGQTETRRHLLELQDELRTETSRALEEALAGYASGSAPSAPSPTMISRYNSVASIKFAASPVD